jgi:hypothetical protein
MRVRANHGRIHRCGRGILRNILVCYAGRLARGVVAARGRQDRGAAVIAPAWVTWAVAAVVLLLAAYSAARLIWRRTLRPAAAADIDLAHLLMGVSMAGMMESRLDVLPDRVWLTVFGISALWFTSAAVRARPSGRAARPQSRCRFALLHAAECLAMVYMLLPARYLPLGSGREAAMPGMAAAGLGAGNPVLALLLCAFMLGCVLWTIDGRDAASLTQAGAAGPAAPGEGARPLTSYSKIAMSLAMGYMLLTMV